MSKKTKWEFNNIKYSYGLKYYKESTDQSQK